MFDYKVLPDLLALTVLVYVFWSMLRRRAGDQLHAWVLGWVLILLHFALQLFDGTPVVLQTLLLATSAIALELAGAAFICAAGGFKSGRRFRWTACIALLATIFYIVAAYFDVRSSVPYYAVVVVLAGCVGAALAPDVERPLRERNVFAVLISLLALSLEVLVHRKMPEYGLDCIFCVIYLMAAVQCWWKFPRRSTGAVTAVLGFVAWASVFPISVMLVLLEPKIHLQDSVWNIPKYIVAIGVLLTLLEEQMERTEHLALHDPLTGLPNRRLLDDRLTKAIERAERNQSRVAVLLVDLDNFKQINDTYGHQVGDEVLRAVATRLHMRVRRADTIGRAGGDEFLIIVSDLLQPHGAEVLVGKLMVDLSEPILAGDTRLNVFASIGVATYPDDAATPEQLRDRADAAMYRRKRESRSVGIQEAEAMALGEKPLSSR